MNTISTWLRELRLPFLTATIAPALVGAALARHDAGRIDAGLLLLAVAGAALLHLGTNVVNDYFDHRSGADGVNVRFVSPFTGGSRLIQEGRLSPRAVLAGAIVLFAAAAAVGVALLVRRGPVILLFGLAGLLSGWFYTAPPVRLAHRGWGELLVGVNFGLLVTVGTYWVLTGRVTAESVVASLPLTFLVADIIIINEFQDSAADRLAGKRTLVVRLGTRRGVALYAATALLAYLPIAAGAAAGLMPPVTLVALLPGVFALRALATARRHHAETTALAPANAATILCHLLTGICLAGAYLIA